MERTLSIIKPDATTRNITGKVNAMIEEAGYGLLPKNVSGSPKSRRKNFMPNTKTKPSLPVWSSL